LILRETIEISPTQLALQTGSEVFSFDLSYAVESTSGRMTVTLWPFVAWLAV